MILEKLADEITNEIDDGGKKALTIETIDIFALTVRGIINESQEERAIKIINCLYPFLLKGIDQSKENIRKEECLDICSELFKIHGLIILRQPTNVNRDQLMKVINQQLTEGKTPNIRKRASFCMGAFAIILSAKQLQTLSSLLMTKIRSGKTKQDQVI